MASPFFISTFLIYVGAFAADSPTNLKDALAQAGVKVVPGSFVVRKVRNSESGGRKRTSVFADDGKSYIEAQLIESISREDAEAMAEAERQITMRLYKSRRTPYRDQFSNTGDCPKAYLPIIKEVTLSGRKLAALFASAGKTRTFGACHKPDVKFIGTMFSTYDESNKRFLKISFFTAADGKHPDEAVPEVREALKAIFPP